MSPSARRLAPWLAAALLLVAGSVAMAVSAQPGKPARQPVRIELSTDSGFAFGIDYADQLPQESGSDVARALGDPGSVGASWIRVDLAWYRIEPRPGTWDWSSFDRDVDYAKAHGLRILAILDQPPAWARAPKCAARLWCPPRDDARFADFAARAAARYPSAAVPAWEVWNEENLGSYWLGGPDPEAYGALLKATSIAIHATRPTAGILVGGLAVAGSAGSNMSAQDFLLGIARSDVLQYATAVGYHPYSFPTPPAASDAFAGVSTGPGSLAAILDRYQQSSMPIWLTEAGAPVPDAGKDPGAATPATKDQERQQAGYAADLVKVATGNPHVAALFWFSDIDLPGQKLYFGLRRADGSSRPSFTALQNAIKAYEN